MRRPACRRISTTVEKGAVFVDRDVHELAGVAVEDSQRPVIALVGLGGDALPAGAAVDEMFAWRGGCGGCEQLAELQPSHADVLDQGRQQWLPDACPVGGAFVQSASVDMAPAHFGFPDRARRDPRPPALGFGVRPALKVEVERPDLDEDRVDAEPPPAARQHHHGFFPLLVGLFGEPQIALGGVDLFDGAPKSGLKIAGLPASGRSVVAQAP
jgi:hypothetical protein